MRRRTYLRRLAGAGAVSGAVAPGVVGGRQAQTTHTVGMYTQGGENYFDPIGLFVQQGDTVRWTIESGAHSTTSYTPGNPRDAGQRLIPQGAGSWNSGVLQGSGQSFEYTFDVTGTYDYYCIPHKTLGMVGRVVCGEPGGPAEQNAIPSSDTPVGVMPPSDVVVSQGSVPWPYVPTTGHGGPPLLFWTGTGVVGLTSLYLFALYDEATGRYDDLPDDELGLRQPADETADTEH